MRRHARAGLTLIEVLLSMLVLVVGIVGVMALFPTAIWTSKRSVEEMQATVIAESVKNGLTNALQFVNAAGQVIFTHDFERTDGGSPDKQIYQFTLPLMVNQNWQRHPGTAGGTGVAPLDGEGFLQNGVACFELTGDPWMKGSTAYIRDTGSMDRSSQEYHFYSFSFDVRKVDLVPWNSDPAAKNASRLYEFVIHVFRRVPQVPPDWGADTTAVRHRWILSMSDRIALK